MKRKIFGFIASCALSAACVFGAAAFSGCSILESWFTPNGGNSGSNQNTGNQNTGNQNTTQNPPQDSTGNGNSGAAQSKTVKIYKSSVTDYRPTGTVNEQLMTSKLLIDLTDVVGSGFDGDLKLDFKVDLSYRETYSSPTPTFTFYYYSQNEIKPNYLIGQYSVSVISKEKKTYRFSLNVHLKGNIIYCARACNYEMGTFGNNIMGMEVDKCTYHLNNYYVTVTIL